MSRIGKLPVDIPEKVDVSVNDNLVTVKGPKGELTKEFNNKKVTVEVKDGQVLVRRVHDKDKDARAFQGLTRSLIDSMVEGVTNGFEKKLEMVGVGYNAKKKGKDLELEVGYSHPVIIEAEDGIEFDVEKNNKIVVRGIDKQQVGEMAAKVRAVRKPEPYKGKGIRYEGEHIRRKEGKTG
ncbi:50S ribosomal protein L6 [Halothermothrix orenii]|uniref:Large ribosomal subunit protein uL6 n=1 Tax=Halothermothrix orenii (strain H 168 / OCM 544 / DSM 9562) TaxID=373903 RepID=RL6_HALOH|nr:50S ribosomal protein L6 [Halothermothrix orenii]B8D0D9.1 RecName: Full=Large ribosomal subunit protein uL6; AltName: Full=50S ribosomal protein L6 [Halothermothrix orenii H 168]ACL68893.1 ribosomal protein L6 [Halothermothrix orenii H 168]